MAKSNLLGLSDLVDQFRSGNFEGFGIKFDKNTADESFENFLETGSIGNIDLSAFDQNSLDGVGDKVSKFLKGEKVGVYANGQKLFNTSFERKKQTDLRRSGFGNQFTTEVTGYDGTDLRFGDSSSKIEVDAPGKNIFDLSSLPKNVNSGEDVAEALNIRKLTFKPVEKVVNTMSNNNDADSSSNTSKSFISKALSGKGLIIAGVAAIGGLYLYIRGD